MSSNSAIPLAVQSMPEEIKNTVVGGRKNVSINKNSLYKARKDNAACNSKQQNEHEFNNNCIEKNVMYKCKVKSSLQRYVYSSGTRDTKKSHSGNLT